MAQAKSTSWAAGQSDHVPRGVRRMPPRAIVRAMLDLARVASLPILVAAFSIPSCGGTVQINGADAGAASGDAGSSSADASSTPDAAADANGDPSLSAFCTGSSPRVVVNGVEEAILMGPKGKSIAMNCCDAGEVYWGVADRQALFTLYWRVAAGNVGILADLSALSLDGGSPGRVELAVGCDPATTASCAAAEGDFASGFQGFIKVLPTEAGDDVTYCVSVSHPPGDPPSSIQSVRFYAPHVISSF
jgi:hypothetical protein